MYEHHEAAIQKLVEYFHNVPEVEALILGGSIAHGFADPTSDIDVMIIVSDADHQDRLREGRLQFFDNQVCTYDGGYVDGKYLGRGFLNQVAESGSEPARFAFLHARVLWSRMERLDEMIQAIARYPVAGKGDRMRRFYAQFEAWNWYANEALRRHDRYLLGVSIGKLVLFGGRLILAHNELLYPYHKWFLRVLEQAEEKPQDLLDRVRAVHEDPSAENVRLFYETVQNFRAWEAPETGWGTQFIVDAELNWLNGATPVDDL